jgi:hypothetical protein
MDVGINSTLTTHYSVTLSHVPLENSNHARIPNFSKSKPDFQGIDLPSSHNNRPIKLIKTQPEVASAGKRYATILEGAGREWSNYQNKTRRD